MSSSSAKSANICARCFKPNASACARCKAVYYCGRDCQKKDWELGHKTRCSELKKQQTKAAAAAAAAASSDGRKDSSEANGDGSSSSASSNGAPSGPDYTSPELPLPSRWLYPPSRVESLWSTPPAVPPVPVGLLNPKAAQSCFFNCILQTLFATRPFVRLLEEMEHREEECAVTSSLKFCIICALEKHRLAVMRNSAEAVAAGLKEAKPLLPAHLLRNLSELNSDYALGNQEDVHDAMKALLSAFDDAWRKNQPALPLRLSQRTLETTPLSQLFGGYLLSELKCANSACAKITPSLEFSMDLPLELLQHTDDLGEMLEAFSRPEKLDADNLYRCGACKEATRARKQITLFEPPNLCMIQLKRFRYGVFGKVNKHVRFPLELSLRRYMSACKLAADGKDGSSPLATPYRLYAVIVHLDLLNVSSFGHYICYVRDWRSKDQWLRCDDESITTVPVEQVMKQNAYILMYQRATPLEREEKVAPEVIASPPPAASPEAASASSSSSDSAASTSSPAAPAAPVDESVQCIGGCGFWGKVSTNSMCSQCYRKWREDRGEIAPAPPKAASSPPPDAGKRESISPDMLLALSRMRQMQGGVDHPRPRTRVEGLGSSMGRMSLGQPYQPHPNPLHLHMPSYEQLAQQQQQMLAHPIQPPPDIAQQWISRYGTSGLPPFLKSASTSSEANIGRNDPCPCKSGQKWKKCHGKGK